MNTKGYGKLTVGLIAVWFIFALSASAMHLFKNASNGFGVAVAIAASAPLIVFSLWYSISDTFRHFALSLNPRALTYLQSGRLMGIVFLILEARAVLPAIFALPAGYGDAAIGATAAFVAWKLGNRGHRNSFILWQALGILDLVTAVSLGTTARLISPGSASMVAMTVLPLSLIPTFFVPLYLIFHIICIAQARAWTAAPGGTRPQVRRAEAFVADGF
jgi:hypothetical protein